MKICLITNLYNPFIRGGAEKIVELISQELQKEHQVIILTTAPSSFLEGCNLKLVEKEKIKIYYLANKNFYHALDDYKYPWIIRFFWHLFDLYNFLIWKKTKKILQQENPDLIITHNLKGFSLGLPLALRKLGIKHVHTLHDLQLIDPAGTLYRKKSGNLLRLPLLLKIYSSLTKRIYKQVKYVISPSKFTLDKHRELGFFSNAKTLTLANPFNYKEKEVRKEKSSKFNILYLGQLEEQKGILFLIKVFQNIKNPNLNLLIAGKGSIENKITKIIAKDNRIEFLVYLNQQEIEDVYGMVNLTVVPSLCYENSPTVIYESYAYRVPVLVSDSGGQVEIVEEGRTGLIFKTGNFNDLREKIIYSFDHKDELETWQKDIQDKIKDYNISDYLKKVFNFIK